MNEGWTLEGTRQPARFLTAHGTPERTILTRTGERHLPCACCVTIIRLSQRQPLPHASPSFCHVSSIELAFGVRNRLGIPAVSPCLNKTYRGRTGYRSKSWQPDQAMTIGTALGPITPGQYAPSTTAFCLAILILSHTSRHADPG